jgi:hypothetical protein
MNGFMRLSRGNAASVLTDGESQVALMMAFS